MTSATWGFATKMSGRYALPRTMLMAAMVVVSSQTFAQERRTPTSSPLPQQRGTVPSEELLTCRTLVDRDARLSCFEQLSDRFAPPDPSVRGVPPVTTGRWLVETSRSEMDDSPIIIVSNDATQSQSGRPFGEERLSLVIRCRERVLSAYILTTGFWGTSNAVEVTLRFDAEAAVTERWEPATNGRAVGLWATARAMAFAQRLSRASRLVVRVATPLGSTTSGTFDIGGFGQHLPALQSGCRVR